MIDCQKEIAPEKDDATWGWCHPNSHGFWQYGINESFIEAVGKMNTTTPIQQLTQSLTANTGSQAIRGSSGLPETLGVWVIWLQQRIVQTPFECGWESCCSLAPPMVVWFEKIIPYVNNVGVLWFNPVYTDDVHEGAGCWQSVSAADICLGAGCQGTESQMTQWRYTDKYNLFYS